MKTETTRAEYSQLEKRLVAEIRSMSLRRRRAVCAFSNKLAALEAGERVNGEYIQGEDEQPRRHLSLVVDNGPVKP